MQYIVAAASDQRNTVDSVLLIKNRGSLQGLLSTVMTSGREQMKIKLMNSTAEVGRKEKDKSLNPSYAV